MKKIFLIPITVTLLIVAAACGKDTSDEPTIPATGSNDNEYVEPNPIENADPDPATDDDDNTTPNDEEEYISYPNPEPLTAELRPVLTAGKRWIKQSIFVPGCERFSETWTALCSQNGNMFGRDTWAIYREGSEHVYGNPEWCYAEDEDGSVYQRGSFDDDDPWTFDKIYFFDPNVELPGQNKNFVQSRGTIVLEGMTRRALRVKFRNIESGYDYWVEGIGPLNGSIIDYSIIHPSCPPGTCEGYPKYVKVLKCYDGDMLIYDASRMRDYLYTEEEVFFPME